MAIRIVGLKNNFSTSSAPYYVRALPSGLVEPDELVRRMAEHPISLTRADISICLLLFTQEVAALVAEGKVVKTGLGSFYVNAAGKLNAPGQAFKPGNAKLRHSLRLGFRPNKAFEATVRAQVLIERVDPRELGAPTIADVVSSGEGYLRIVGKRLKFDENDPEQGLFFIAKTETRAFLYFVVAPSQIIARAPAGLRPGSFALVLRSKQGGRLLREARSPVPWMQA